MNTQHTPGPWAVDADPIEDQGYKTLIVLPCPNGPFATWIARAEHNWNEAGARERRISWAEAQANARLIASSPDLLEALEAVRNNMRKGVTGAEARKGWGMANAAIVKARGEQT